MININNIQNDIFIEKTTKGLANSIVTYRHHLHNILIAEIQVLKVKNKVSGSYTYHINNFSTINFQGTPKTLDDQNDLDNFAPIQEKYKVSRQLLVDTLGDNKIYQLGSSVFEDAIVDIWCQGGKHVELYAAPTSRGFYQKICNRLQEKHLIESFGMSYKGAFNIELYDRDFNTN